MDIRNTLEVLGFVRDILKAAGNILEDGKVKPLEVALEGRTLLRPGADAIKDFNQIPQEILDLDGTEYETLKAAAEGLKSDVDQFLAILKANKAKK